jgi:hypothetical protein
MVALPALIASPISRMNQRIEIDQASQRLSAVLLNLDGAIKRGSSVSEHDGTDQSQSRSRLVV